MNDATRRDWALPLTASLVIREEFQASAVKTEGEGSFDVGDSRSESASEWVL